MPLFSMFSKKKKDDKKPDDIDIDNVVIDVKTKIQQMTNEQTKINDQADKLRNEAKVYITKQNNVQAKFVLNKRQMILKSLEKLNQQILILQQSYQNLLDKIKIKDQIEIMKQANIVQNKLLNEFDIAEYQQQLSELQKGDYQVEKINEMQQQYIDNKNQMNTDLDLDMQQLQDEIAAEMKMQIGNVENKQNIVKSPVKKVVTE